MQIGAANTNYVKSGTKLTPLHWAAFNGDNDVVQFLLDHGATLQINSHNQTAIGLAGICDNSDVSITGELVTVSDSGSYT